MYYIIFMFQSQMPTRVDEYSIHFHKQLSNKHTQLLLVSETGSRKTNRYNRNTMNEDDIIGH